jgi:hypothetical protein
MTRNDITQAQAAKLTKALYPHLNFLFRLRRRMDRLEFSPADTLFQLVDAAYLAPHHFNVDVRVAAELLTRKTISGADVAAIRWTSPLASSGPPHRSPRRTSVEKAKGT